MRRQSQTAATTARGEVAVDWPEDQLVDALLSGDEAAFDHLAQEYFPKVYRFALRKLADPEQTRDLVQTALGKAMHALADFRRESSLLTWLCACAHNEIRMHLRARSRSREVDLDDEALERTAESRDDASARASGLAPEAPDRLVLRSERAGLVHAVLDLLPEKSATALQMKYLESCPVAEIAAALDLTPKAAESLLSRSRASFRREFERLEATPGPYTEPGADGAGVER